MNEVEFDASFEVQSSKRTSPEAALYIALLRDAMEEIGLLRQSIQREVSHKMWTETVEWILEEDNEWPGSFNRIVSDILNRDPNLFRQWLQKKRCKCCKLILMKEPCREMIGLPILKKDRSQLRIASCHPDRVHHARGLCDSCFRIQRRKIKNG